MLKTVSGEKTWQGKLGHKLNPFMLHKVKIHIAISGFTFAPKEKLKAACWSLPRATAGMLGHCNLLSNSCSIYSPILSGLFTVFFSSTLHLE